MILGKIRRGLIGFFVNSFSLKAIPAVGGNAITIGKTVSGQPISCYVIGKGKPSVLLVGGIHGNEIGTVRFLTTLIHHLEINQGELDRLKLFIVPCLNLDGYQEALSNPDYFNGGRVGRFNAHGVDLNRNFPTKSFQPETSWNHGKDYSQSTKVFAGKSGGGEPEIKALIQLIKHEQIKFYFAFHNAGADVMGNALPKSQELAQLYGQKCGFKFTSESVWQSFHQTGTAKEWTEEQKIAYIEVEGTSRWASDWVRQKPALFACLHSLNDQVGRGHLHQSQTTK